MKFYERVISDFGGYEKCKDILSQPNIDFIVNAQGLREHMLEYRRQHNIFEVGDFIFHPMFGALFEIKRIAEKYVVASTKSGYETNLLIELISHATDEEIKAGKRLEVNQ